VEPHERFGRNLKRARHARSWTQEALAHAAGLHSTEVGRLERGDREPRLSTIVRLARALELTAADLVDGVK
jgi:transcriptional regulator with XRE-family HTH domain